MSTVDDPKLPAVRLDAALIVNAYHEMMAQEEILRHVRGALKSGGTFVLMEGIWDTDNIGSPTTCRNNRVRSPPVPNHNSLIFNQMESGGREPRGECSGNCS